MNGDAPRPDPLRSPIEPPFHVFLQRRPAGIQAGPWQIVDGRRLQTVHLADPARVPPINLDLEHFAQRLLLHFPRVHWEPDGWFLWTSGDAVRQLQGTAYECAQGIAYVELKGRCPSRLMRHVITALSLPPDDVIVQLAQAGLFVACPSWLGALPPQ